MTALVTGGTGLVGGAIVRELLKRRYRVRALVREPARGEALAGLGVELCRGDILDPDSVERACRGCQLVFHAAAIYEFWVPDPGQLTRTEVQGTRNVLEIAVRQRVERVIYTSTAATVGEPKGVIGNEQTLHRGYFLSRYEKAKFEAERVADDYARRGLDLVVVKPAAVIGPGDLKPTGQTLLAVLSGRLPAISTGVLSVVYVGDAGLGHVLAAERGRPGEAYILASAIVSTRELFGLACELAGVRRPWVVPASAALLFAALCETWARWTNKRPLLTREAVRTVAHGLRVDGSKAARELGLSYTPVRQALEEAIVWYWQQGLLARKPACAG